MKWDHNNVKDNLKVNFKFLEISFSFFEESRKNHKNLSKLKSFKIL